VRGDPSPLLDRAAECRALDELLNDVRGGRSAALVIRGEPGTGKTVLLGYCGEQASGFRVVRVAGVESEIELPFAGLHQLCGPLLDRLETVPAPQRRALQVAFGLAMGEAPDRFLVALATLSLLAEAATEQPMLCLIDDAQWLDAASAQVLGFVARRLLAESVALVFVVREEPDAAALAGLPELRLAGLPEHDAHALLNTVIAGGLDAALRARLVAETRGNPLALLELPRDPYALQLPTGTGAAHPQPLAGRIEASFTSRLATLSAQTRTVLLIAAAEPLGDPLLLWRAAERLGTVRCPEDVDTRGLLAIGERVVFSHPLVRSAVYRSASHEQRRAVHLALAQATDPEADPDRRAWHLAAAAHGPDEEIAAELERSAGRAQRRGGLASAAANLRRSVALTVDPGRRSERALAAAQASLNAGEFDHALAMLGTAEASAAGELAAARIELLRAQVIFATASSADAPLLLFAAASRLEPLDARLARETYLQALGAALFAGPGAVEQLRKGVRSVRTLRPLAGEPGVLELLVDGIARLVADGRAAAAPALLRALDSALVDDASDVERVRWGWMLTAPANALWEEARLRVLCERQIRSARDAGALGALPIYLVALASLLARCGDFPAATSLVAQADAVAQTTGTQVAPYTAVLLQAAVAGREDQLAAASRTTVEQATATGQGVATTVVDWVHAVLYNALGRHDDAQRAAQRATSAPGDLFAAMWALPELIEAAALRADLDVATAALEELVQTTRPAATEWGLGLEARSRALVSRSSAADDLYREAIERLGRTAVRSELARAHLLYGEWLHRAQRGTEARDHLRRAEQLFTGMGMTAFSERATRGLHAMGDRRHRRVDRTHEALTPQEVQIAELARDGLSNPEIGARLFLSPRTVEWHLRKVFTKLGIGSRRELRTVLQRD
jgi:DNA-binding CsgD family transcriptional regulator